MLRPDVSPNQRRDNCSSSQVSNGMDAGARERVSATELGLSSSCLARAVPERAAAPRSQPKAVVGNARRTRGSSNPLQPGQSRVTSILLTRI
ncbi:hypothetical protein DPEC_G00291750 [Dallia pectoralis]|uniref:Uncharacterized protein n=1 Tax=Dallia pectoralis TaxID=75939 RepID=A0ACC2FHP9_DALPE|nr:hypothetical protein DPEC_G00291750 [Dallia pectoralis]